MLAVFARLTPPSTRKYVENRKFNSYRRAMRRPMIVNVLEARDMPIANKDHASADPYVIVTVHDGYHRDQVLRYDTETQYETLDAEWEPQNFLVPGVNGNAVLVFTVVDEEDVRDQFIGQASLSLSRGDLWKNGGSFDINLGDHKYMIKDNKAQESDMAYAKVGLTVRE